MQQPWGMQNIMRCVSLDAATVQFQSEHEVDSAIDTVVTFAFGNSEPLDRYLFRIRAALPSLPTVKELVDAVFATRLEFGPITDEVVRRENAALAMAAFLSADPADLGLEAAMFRLGAEVWLTPSRTPRS
jgi:hypothetical protein